jgi:hypothetical protein
MKKSELRQIINEEINKQRILEEKNIKANKINQSLSDLIEKIKNDFDIKNALNTHRVVQHHLNVNNQVKVKNGVKQNERI